MVEYIIYFENGCDIVNNEIANMMRVEYHPNFPIEQLESPKYMKIPFSDIAAIGAGLSTLIPACRTVTQTTVADTTNLYRRVDNIASELKAAKGHPGLCRGIVERNGKFNGGTLFEKVTPTSVTSTLTIPCDPTAILAVVMLANIQRKLDIIQDTQNRILDFLIQKEKANLRNNLLTLSDIMNNYKYNWDNDLYKRGKYDLVQTIRREVGENILQYKHRISAILNKRTTLHGNSQTSKIIDDIANELNDYRLAIYMFGFASFLEIMLQENFNAPYLEQVAKYVNDFDLEYRDIYSRCYSLLEQFSKTSVQANISAGIASLSKNIGNTISKIPYISNGQLDENLIMSSVKAEHREKNRVQTSMSQILANRDSGVHIFIENIHTVNRIQNTPQEILFDSDYIYIETAIST